MGPLQVRQHGLPVAVPGAKPRAVLTMLGLNGGSVVSADTLAELLWGARPPRTAVKALQTHISSLRRALGDGFVLTEGTGWTLSTTDIDAARYKVAARLGRDAIAAGDASQAVARFDEALSLWRGIPELPDGPRAASEKTRWIEGHAALVEDRADALLATGRAAEIVGELEAAIADAPLRERRWGQLMLALYRAGRQGEALGAYQRARSLLADELGVDPGPNLRRLEAAIVSQDAALEIPVSQQLSTVTKAVTFLLTDIEGSTAAWEADADAMAVALARHDEIVEQVVTSRGGRLVKTRGEGDATFSVFDRPSAAAAAAIELQEAIRHEPWALADPMRIRVALHTGEVELRDGDYFGRAVNRAARLRSLADGGQILCSGATAELVIDSLSDDVILADLGMRNLKNLARPEHVFELRLEAADDSPAQPTEAPIQRPALPAVLTGPGPFVGRGTELAGLLAAWQSTLAAGARAVLVAGEPGVGKTRLAGEWSRQAYEQGAVVLYGRCDEDLGAAYQPFAEALRSLVPCLGANRLRGLRGVEALLALVPGLTEVVPDLPTPSRSDPDTERYALFDAVVALLAAASSSAPVVLILDDLHWAAKPTLLLLRHLLRFGEHARVQIVGTYRNTDLDRSHPLAAMLADLHRDGTATRLSLSGLDEDDVTAYVAEAGYDDEELARALASVTGGNPFFLIEALRHVDESGGRWDSSTLPQGVREAVSRRLSRLPAETNKALAAAAVVGSRFPLALVESVVGDDLIDAFDEASKAGIVIEEPGGRYRFNHAIVRQSLLAELASVRRMRLHQKIAVTLETESGADDELLAELAYHYFECAWAGNAAKAVEYCRRAADQAIERLAYEGAADLYDRALHALEELDEELSDRDAQQAELLVARCEALLAAGDVVSAAGAVSQLQRAAGDSVRLTAWGTCFDGQLSMLTNPERLDEIESAVGAAAEQLAGLEDAAGEANAHTVRAACLARLGRIGDAETALDQALTAARRAHEHRRVNAVLAGAPLAALWGPNPVPRAGGRCLDVVRLLRITTGSPVVEATSTRCQGVLDALRGRAAAGRALIDSARRSLTELGMRHALLEVEQFAGIVELVAGDPGAAEAHLRRAYNGFRRMGLDADTAETAALMARACLALDRDTEADELCTESERLAGHALKASIAWRSARAQLLARGGAYDEARRVAEEGVAVAERTDLLVDHGDACLTLAVVLGAAGDSAAAWAAAEQAVELYERKGAAALAEMARSVLGQGGPSVPAVSVAATVEPDNECVRVLRRVDAAVLNMARDELEQEYASEGSIESRRKIVGFGRIAYRPSEFASQARDFGRGMGARSARREVVAVRGERLALTRLGVGTADTSPGAPQDEMLQLVGLDEEGRIALQIWFDVEDVDAAIAEMDAQHVRLELDTACVRVISRLDAAYDRDDWDEVAQCIAPVVSVESRRKIVGIDRFDNSQSEWLDGAKHYREALAQMRYRHTVVAARGERLALTSLEVGPKDQSPGAPRDALLQLYGLDETGRLALHIHFDIDDLDAAMAELDAEYVRLEEQLSQTPLENECVRVGNRVLAAANSDLWDEFEGLYAVETTVESHRKMVGFRQADLVSTEWPHVNRRALEAGAVRGSQEVIAVRGERLALARVTLGTPDESSGAPNDVYLQLYGIDEEYRISLQVFFDLEDIDAAMAELDVRFLAGEAAPYAHAWSVVVGVFAALGRHEIPPATPDWVNIDHRAGTPLAHSDLRAIVATLNELTPNLSNYVESVHLLHDRGALFTQVSGGTSPDGFDAEWRILNLLMIDGDKVSRCELFDEADIDSAITKFEALSRPAPQLENAASRADAQFNALFADSRFDEIGALLVDDLRVEDRRRGLHRVGTDRATELAEVRAIADLGTRSMTSEVIAVRGERLALVRTLYSGHTGRDQRPDAFHTEVLRIAQVDANGQIVAYVAFDLDDMDQAIAELETRYLGGEAAVFAHPWSVIARTYAEFNRQEHDPSSVVNIDHRRVARFAPGDLTAANTKGITPNLRAYVQNVHRLGNLGAVVTCSSYGTSQEGFEAEWRTILLQTVDGDLMTRNEMFDEADLDAALARFDELSRPAPQLENAASREYQRFNTYYTTGDWEALATTMAEDFYTDDRRRFVGAGGQPGRNAAIDHAQVTADLGVRNATSTVIAIRGQRLALMRARFWGRGELPDAFHTEVLHMVEIDSRQQIATFLAFDLDDLDAAIAEVDARYASGEAAPHARVWSVLTRAFAALNRREVPTMTKDWVRVDHRSLQPFVAGDWAAYLHETWRLTPDVVTYIEAVHRLSSLGAVVTHTAYGTSHEGFDAQWRMIDIFTVDGELISRAELFDEADLDAALARFDELSRPAPRLDNATNRVVDRYLAHFATRDWDVMADALAEHVSTDDRRRVVNAGARSGRDAEIANMQAMAEIGCTNITSIAVALRGERLVLARHSFTAPNWPGLDTETIDVVESGADGRIVAEIAFDPEDIEAAIAELDTRYLAGEAAPYAHTWSVILQGYAAVERHEIPAWTPDAVNIDHRRAAAFAPGELSPYLHAMWDQTPDASIYIEAVHRLTSFGAVVTHVAKATSHQGFEGEWREITLSTIEGDRINRSEMFDEADLDAALAKFDELSQPAQRLENAASKAHERLLTHLAAHDWDAMAQTMTDDIVVDDRRHVVNAGVRHGREAAIADSRAIADLGVMTTTSTAIAARGEHLILTRLRAFGADPESFQIEILHLVQVVRDDQVAAIVMFDPDDIEAAFEELDKRYLDGEAAAHAHTWSIITHGFAALNRREIPATSPDWVTIDHRLSTSFEPGELAAYIRSLWDVASNVSVYIETVYRVSDFGALVCSVTRGRTHEGFDAEWREINLATVDGELVTRTELFDHADLDTALARFDELSRPIPALENAASQVNNRFDACFVARDWAGMAAIVAEDMYNDDRRRVVGAGMRHGRDAEIANMRAVVDLGVKYAKSIVVATRGQHLALLRTRFSGHNQGPEAFHTEIVDLVEINADNKITRRIAFDADNVGAAFEELDARYLAGEAASHAQAWSAVIQTTKAFSRREIPAGTSNAVTIDHRHGAAFAPGELTAYMRATWHLSQQTTLYVEAVQRLSSSGAVITLAAHATSRDGFSAEWRVVNLFMFEGTLVDRCEVFDEADLDDALATFDDLNLPALQHQNAASRMITQFQEVFGARDWDGMAEIFADDICLDDRRRVVGVGFSGRDAILANMRASADVGVKSVTSTVIATRGNSLAMHRVLINGRDKRPEAFRTDALVIGEVDGRNRIIAFVMFDLGDIDAAFEELDARYLAGEAAAHAHTWSVIAEGYATLNRHELPPTPPDFVSLDRRRGGGAFAAGELLAFVSASWDDTPDNKIRVEVVHRLNDLGAVVSSATRGSSLTGFAPEWREIDVVTVGGDMINRTELYDEDDLNAALARLDELSLHAQRPVNAASRLSQRRNAYFAARDWDALAETLSEGFFSDDRRTVVSAGVTRGRHAQVASNREAAALGVTTITSTFIAIRGERVALSNTRISGSDTTAQGFYVEQLGVVEIDADERMVAYIAFDVDDVDAAFKELDARYLAHLAPGCAHTWSVIAESFARINRRDLPESARDVISIDHSHVTKMAPGDLRANILAGWDVVPDIYIRIEAVHRITDVGAVLTWVATGTSREGFEAEWRSINVQIIDGEIPSRVELFDEDDLDAALARFDELSRHVPRLENAASRMYQRYIAFWAARDWEAVAGSIADEICHDDRRRVVNGGIQRGRDAVIANMRAITGVGVKNVEYSVIATRGDRLALGRSRVSGGGQWPQAFGTELLNIVEVDADNRFIAGVAFDLDDIDAAFEKLESRFIAGEAAPHANLWTAITQAYAGMTRGELPPTSSDLVNIDHRRVTSMAPDHGIAYLRASWDLAPEFQLHVEAVHRLSDLGAVFTRWSKGTSKEGFDAEWRAIDVITVDGDLINRGEIYEEADLDAALARFDELSCPATPLEKLVSKVGQRLRAAFAARDWEALAALLADDLYNEDRRRVVNGGIKYGRDSVLEDMRAAATMGIQEFATIEIATRGERLVLVRAESSYGGRPGAFYVENLAIAEVDADARMTAQVMFDLDDVDAAFEELDARYLEGEAAAYADTWSAIVEVYAAFNRDELPSANWVNIDHRRGTPFASSDLSTSIRTSKELTPDLHVCAETVHRLSRSGAVITNASFGTSQAGFKAEWRMLQVLMVEGGRVYRCELFDDADIDAALARFDELTVSTSLLENAATRANARVVNTFNRRNMDGYLAALTGNAHYDDRRKGLQNAGPLDRQFVGAMFEPERAMTWQLETEHVGIRGRHLALTRHIFRDAAEADRPITLAALLLVETTDDELLDSAVLFDPDDIDAAMAELTARWIARGEVAHPQVIEAACRSNEAYNRHAWEVMAAMESGATYVNHRQLVGAEPETIEDHWRSIRALAELVPDMWTELAEVITYSAAGVLTHVVVKGTTVEATSIELPAITLILFDGTRVTRMEAFDLDQRDLAVARFQEFSR